MLLFQNAQHVRALTAIAQSCTTVRRFETNAAHVFFACTLQNNGVSSDNMTRLLAMLWAEHKARVHVSVGGKYYATLKPTLNGKYAAYELIFTSNDKRRNTYTHVEHYNSTGGYWYTPAREQNKAAQNALNSKLFVSIRAIVTAFNRSLYIR